jgi:ERCC4-type nuclease
MSFILESFQNIGPKNSEKLLKKFKSLRNIFSASQEQLEEEIGKKSESFSILDEKY